MSLPLEDARPDLVVVIGEGHPARNAVLRLQSLPDRPFIWVYRSSSLESLVAELGAHLEELFGHFCHLARFSVVVEFTGEEPDGLTEVIDGALQARFRDEVVEVTASSRVLQPA